MSDYISREDAVDELQVKVFHNLTDEYYGTMQVLTELPAADVAPVVFCKDCVKHNKKIGFDENFHPVWKEDACPLVSWRGKAQGGEFDYQFCSYGERREE